MLYAVFGIGTMAGALTGGAIVGAALVVAGHTAGALGADLRAYPWHPVFLVNVATGIATMLMARSLPDDGRAPNPALARSFDFAGALLIATFAASLMITVTGDRWESLVAGLAALASLAVFVRHIGRARTPLIDPTLFAARGPAMLYGIAAVFGIPSFSLTIYSATYYIAQFHASAAQAGLALFALAALYVTGAIAGGALINRLGSRALLSAGAILVTVSTAMLAGLTSTSEVVGAMALGGLGLGFASAPPNALILRYAPSSRAGAATGVATMLATSGSITAPAVIGAFLAASQSVDAATALRAEFALCAVLAGACAIAACALPKPVAFAA
jgi:MFS family permease